LRNEQLKDIKLELENSGFSIVDIDGGQFTFCNTEELLTSYSSKVIKLKVAHTPTGFKVVRFSKPDCADAHYMKMEEVEGFKEHIEKAKVMIEQIKPLLEKLSKQFPLIQ